MKYLMLLTMAACCFSAGYDRDSDLEKAIGGQVWSMKIAKRTKQITINSNREIACGDKAYGISFINDDLSYVGASFSIMGESGESLVIKRSFPNKSDPKQEASDILYVKRDQQKQLDDSYTIFIDEYSSIKVKKSSMRGSFAVELVKYDPAKQ